MRSAASMLKTYQQLDIFETSLSSPGIKQAVRYLFFPGAAPEHISSLGTGSSGWLERYIVMRSSRPYEYWRWCYLIEGKFNKVM
jgi:hypothetical protein